MLLAAGACLYHRRAASRAMGKGMLPGKLCHRQQGGYGHVAEAIATRSSSPMSESATRCIIVDNMEASHRRVAAGTDGEYETTSVSRWHARGEA